MVSRRKKIVNPETPAEEAARLQVQREAIARTYKHSVPSYDVRKQLREQTLRVGRDA